MSTNDAQQDPSVEFLGSIMSMLPKMRNDGSISSYSASSSHIYIQIKRPENRSLLSKLFGSKDND